MRSKTLVLLFAALFGTPLLAAAQTTDSAAAVARDYLETLYAFDFEGLTDRMAPDAVFRDLTAAPLAGAELEYTGREEIISSFEASAGDSRNSSFEIQSEFTTGDYVVFTLQYSAELRGSAVGIDGEWIPVRVPAVTVIRVADGLVAEHVDYVGYDALLQQVAEFPRPN